MKIMTVVGARPNFMKAAPIIAAIRQHNNCVEARLTGDGMVGAHVHHVFVHTGQHYDRLMSDSFFEDLNLPVPDYHLGVGSGTHAEQTAEIMRRFEAVALEQRPDVLIVVGDVNSTVACALVTAKLSFGDVGTRPLIAHVEAGLRSFDRTMPEEVNRIVSDHLSDVLFVTEESGVRNLLREGIPAEKIHFVGNTMIDSLLMFQEKAESSTVLEKLRLRSDTSQGASIAPFGLLTLHRPSNVDNQEAFVSILKGLEELSAGFPVVFPVHPRTRQRIRDYGVGLKGNMKYREESNGNGVILTDPLGYLDFLCLMKHASIVVTDSGGIQEETTVLGVPCVTVRDNTERPVTVECGTNIVAGTQCDRIRQAIRQHLANKQGGRVPKNWDGKAAGRILEILRRVHACSTRTGDG